MNFNVDEFTKVMAALSTGNSDINAISKSASEKGREIGSIVKAEDNALESQFDQLAMMLEVLQGRVDMVVSEISQAFMEYMIKTKENQESHEEELQKFDDEMDSIRGMLDNIQRR